MSSEMHDESKKSVAALTEEALISLENEKNRGAKLTKEDCIYWAACGYWDTLEAATLINGLDKRRAVVIFSDFKKTQSAKISEIYEIYKRCIEIGEVEDKTLINQDLLGNGLNYGKQIVTPKGFLLWAKSKGLPIPPMLWSAVFQDEEINKSVSNPHPFEEGNNKTSDNTKQKPASKKLTVQSEKAKDKDRVADGEKTGHMIRKFKEKVRQHILDDKKSRLCNCNQLKYSRQLKATWASLKNQIFAENVDLVEYYTLRLPPVDYLHKICLKTFSDMNKKKETSESEKTKWQIVRTLAKNTPQCPIAQHNDF